MPLLTGISGSIMSLFVKRKQYAVRAKIVAAALTMPKPRERKCRRTGQKRKR